ncbi:hypothetical protein AB0D62_38575 [Streptomyces massasporeus]|uniref:hypothetical protein n=1 Tax=Streptomyces massasporeus TaxID=67324 RepID=UPI0034082440
MAMLLAMHAHVPIVVRWAWHAFKGERFPDLPGVAELIESQINYFTKRIWQEPATECPPPDEYAEILLKDLKRQNSNDASEVLEGFGAYLSMLTPNGSDPVRQLCENVCDASIAAYRDHGVNPPADLRLNMCAMPLQNAPDHSKLTKCHADAKVTPGCNESCCRETRQHDQTLTLQLAPAKFDSATLAALPFLLFHECVSHVLQGPHGHEREVPGNGSAFAEGWMDKAAWEVFSTVHPTTILPYACARTFYSTGGARAHAARHEPQVEGRDAWLRTLGWQAASHALELFQQELGSVVEASRVFLRLSFEWNTSTEAMISRDTAALIIGGVLRYDKPTRRHDSAEILVPALLDYAGGGRLRALLDAVAEVQKGFPH